MSNAHSIAVAREQIAAAVSTHREPPFYPFNASPYVAMSALQKSIRRGRRQAALRAAATVLQSDPARLWRRLGCVAFEDIGVADLETVALATASLTGKKFRTSLGGDWRVASYIIDRMVCSPKCRAADDLLLLAESHSQYEGLRTEFADLGPDQLITIVNSQEPLPLRALACWYATGTNGRRSKYLKPRRGDPNLLFEALLQSVPNSTVMEVAREGWKKTREVLCPFVALLSAQLPSAELRVCDDELPPELLIRDVPSWAFDIYTREGRAALQAFINGQTPTAVWVREHIPPSQRLAFVGGILFRSEGGMVRSRLIWPIGEDLRRSVDAECNGPYCPDATIPLHLMRGNIPN
jgi:hypothetical protein